jgi:MOSC domain-containing protein
MQGGVVREIWRYPVKSMAGERLEATVVGGDGVAGDRAYALRDETVGEIRGAKNLPDLLRFQARYLEPPRPERAAAVVITLPDGSSVQSDAADVNARLSAALGRAVTLWPRQPTTDRAHYRRVPPESGDLLGEVRRIFGLDENDPLPALDQLPPDVFEFVGPLGTYFDAFPLHLLTTTTLATLSALHPAGRFDRRRFRPNLLLQLDPAAAGCPEEAWCQRSLRIGSLEVRVAMPVARCVMTSVGQDDLPADPGILRTIVKQNHSNTGVYAEVTRVGSVRLGDRVEILDS